jgi:hypothetical protein
MKFVENAFERALRRAPSVLVLDDLVTKRTNSRNRAP